jgi:predicted exporter/SAM-dependent methyltransferase
MSEPFVRIHLFLARHRRLVLAGVVLFGAVALLCGRQLRMNEDYSDMLPLSDPAIAEQAEALKHVRQADRMFIDVQTAGPAPERLVQAADRMDSALREIAGLGEIRYNIESGDLQGAFEELQAQLPALLSSNDLREMEGKLEPSALEQRLAWMKQAMSQPQGLMLKSVAQTDPAGVGDAVSLRLRDLQAGAGGARIVEGRITSADGRHLLISAVPRFRSSDLQRSAPVVAAVLKAARGVEAEFPGGSVRVAVTGAHRIALENARMIQHDTALASVIATVAVAGLMFAVYRRRWLALLGLAPTLFGALGALVVFYLNGDPVSAVALGCGSILIGVTVDYGIYVLYHIDDAPPPDREQLARAVAQLAPAVAFGALTTMAAFLVMFVSPVSGHRQLGLFGVVGVALAAMFALVILPLFIPGGAAVGRRSRGAVGMIPPVVIPVGAARGSAGASPCRAGRELPLTGAMRRLAAWRARQGRMAPAVLLAFSVLCAAGVLRLRFEGDFVRLNGVTPEARRDEEVVAGVWGKTLSLTTVVVTGANREEALQLNERVCARLRTLQQEGAVESFASIAPLFPSEQTRRANLRCWTAFWSDARRQSLGSSLADAAAKLGYRAGAFAPFLERLATAEDISASGPEATPALDRLLGDFWSGEDGRVSVCTLVKAGDRAGFPRLREAIRQAAPGALLLDKAALSDEIIHIARRALPVFAALVVALNAVLLFLLLGRVELVLITLLPMAAGLFWTLGTMGLMGQPIDMANFIFAIFVIGVGGDYSLFMVLAELEPWRGRADRTAATSGAVTICAGAALSGVGVLVLARHPAMFSIGLSAWLGISLTLLATLFLVPPCMARLRRRAARSTVILTEARPDSAAARRRQVRRLYRHQGPYVEQYVCWKLRADPLFEALDQAAPRQGHILDVGCGYGLAGHWLLPGAPQRTLHGLDHDATKIRVARAAAGECPRVRFEEGDLLAAEWPACDALLLCDVLHYFPRELKARILQKALEALRPGGRLIVRDACGDTSRAHRMVAWGERFAVWIGHNRTERGLHFESAAGYVSLLEAAGFSEVRRIAGAGIGSNAMFAARKAER